jgi:hypothetical protein
MLPPAPPGGFGGDSAEVTAITSDVPAPYVIESGKAPRWGDDDPTTIVPREDLRLGGEPPGHKVDRTDRTEPGIGGNRERRGSAERAIPTSTDPDASGSRPAKASIRRTASSSLMWVAIFAVVVATVMIAALYFIGVIE